MLVHGLTLPQGMEIHTSILGYNFQHVRKEHKHSLLVDLEDFLLRDEDLSPPKEVILLVEARLIVDAVWEDFYLAVDQQPRAEGTLIGSSPVQFLCKDWDVLDETFCLSYEGFVAVP